MRSQKNRNILRRLIPHPTPHTPNPSPLLREPFRNKGSRYYILLLLFCSSAFLLFCFSGCDKEEKIMNIWNLQSVTMNGKTLTDSSQYHLLPRYTYYSFYYENRMNVETYAKGQFTESADGYYKLSKKNTILDMKFTILNQRSNISAKVKKLTKKELQLEYKNNGNTYFLKLYSN